MNLKLKFSQNLYPSQIPEACISKSQSGPEFGTATDIKKIENYIERVFQISLLIHVVNIKRADLHFLTKYSCQNFYI